MGGFHLYDCGKPLYPLGRAQVLALVKRGALVPPTSREIEDRSKSDAVSKGLAVVQTLWFTTQCIARLAAHLPIANLEVTTLAYNVITIAMYIAWWKKPLNVNCPFRGCALAGHSAIPSPYPHNTYPTWKKMIAYVLGNQDVLVEVSHLQRVPTFWSDDVGDMFDEDNINLDAYFMADIIALAIAMIFGAVHCIAWSYTLPTEMEQVIWRVSAVAVIAVPLIIALVYLLSAAILFFFPTVVAQVVGTIVAVTCAVGYIAARVALLVLSFTSLRHLPLAVQQTISWTTHIPHIYM